MTTDWMIRIGDGSNFEKSSKTSLLYSEKQNHKTGHVKMYVQEESNKSNASITRY